MSQQFAVCRSVPCERWGLVPTEFDERKHFLKCPKCGTGMMPTYSDPLRAAYKEDHKVVPVVVPQK